ncbi:MAG: hypothetical protein AB2375_07135 [Tissierellaceae bacterium]
MPNGKIITANCGDDTISIIEKAHPFKVYTIYLRDLVMKNIGVLEGELNDKIGPTSLVMDKFNNLLVVNSYDDSLFKIDLDNDMLLGGIKVGRCPTVIKVYDGKLYILNSDSDSLSVVEEENLTLLESINIGGRPTDMQIDKKDGHMYITNSNSHSLSIVGLDSYDIYDLELHSQPLKVRIEGDIIFIMCFLNNGLLGYSGLFAIKKVDHRMIWSRKIKGVYYDFIKLKGLDYFYLINADDGYLYGLDIESGIFDKKLIVGGLPNKMVYDGKNRLYINDLLNNQIIVIDIGNNNKIEEKIRVGKEPQDILLL